MLEIISELVWLVIERGTALQLEALLNTQCEIKRSEFTLFDPLAIAVECKKTQFVKMLLNHGLDPNYSFTDEHMVTIA